MEERRRRAPSRRGFLAMAAGAGAALGAALSLGQLGRIALAFLYPRRRPGSWLFVVVADRLEAGRSMGYTAPGGQSVVVSRTGRGGGAGDFVALSDVCPHLGCKVHWEGGSGSFFCPCHNGRFDSAGRPLTGPPAQAGQELVRFPLKVEGGLLYIRVPSESLVRLSALRRAHDGRRARA